mgnify:CR=1 FL=1|tara:strand:- start:2421 stop:2822 length:402 start_codon:yes stop_codon:yes gene_type:complete
MSFGYFSVGFGAGGKAPLSGSISNPSDLIIEGISPGATHDTTPGQIDYTATASGGSGSYTYSWSISETRDDTNNVATLSLGSQNAAQYNTATLRCTQNASPPPLTEALYHIECEISDGATTVIVQTDFNVLMV